jgi:shikimate dehydrogenase
MQQFGLIGKSLEHSFSKQYFTDFFLENSIDAKYSNFNIASEADLQSFLQTTNAEFANVTIPYKQSIIKYLDAIDTVAEKVGAINCIKKINGNWVGTNTDVFGFQKSFKHFLQPNNTHAMIIGNGGAAQAIKFVLHQLNIPFVIVTRKSDLGTIHFADMDENIMNKYTIIINTTPLGMYPNVDSFPPIPYQYLTANHYLFDLVYNPLETLFLQKGKLANATCRNGFQMLEEQAKAAWDWWNAY